MGCNCKVTELVIGIVLLIVSIAPNLLRQDVTNWIVVIGAALLVIHALMCKNCGKCVPMSAETGKVTRVKAKSKPARKKKR